MTFQRLRSRLKRLAGGPDVAALVRLCEDRLRDIGRLQSEMAELREARSRLLDEVSVLRSAATPYRGRPIPVMMGVDIEPDARSVDLDNPSWNTSSAFFAKIADLRSRVQDV